MGTLEAPQDRHGYIHRTGFQSGTDRPRSSWSRELRRPWRSRELGKPWRSRELGRPWRSRELGRPWRDRFRDRGPSPHLSLFRRSPTTPPQNFLGEAQGYQEPSGAKQTQTVIKKTVVTVWSNTATAGWLVNSAAAGWRDHNRLA